MKKNNAKKIIWLLIFMCFFCSVGLGAHAAETNKETEEEESVYVEVESENTIEHKTTSKSGETKETPLSVEYQAHVANLGWMSAVKNGQTGGTVGRGLRMEALKIFIPGVDTSQQLQYRTKTLGQNWGEWTVGGKESGTTGRSLGLEAVEIKVPETMSETYNVFYRVHVANLGWLGWTKNGETAGSQYYGYSIEAIEVKILQVDDKSVQTGIAFSKGEPTIEYQAHVSNIGWMNPVKNGQLAGTEGKALKMEALKLSIPGLTDNKEFTYRTCGLGYSWSEWKTNGSETGSTGKSVGLQAIEMKISGSLSEEYDLYYRVHVANLGWLGWAKNGETAGTRFYGYAIEAVNIKLVKKNQDITGTGNSYVLGQPSVLYQAHVSNEGWQRTVDNGKTAGTTGKSRKIEAIKIDLPYSSVNNPVIYRTKSSNEGWGAWTSSGQQAGTTGLSKGIEAIEIKLSEELTDTFEIYYRVHSSFVGWLEWTKNGATAGTEGFNYPIEAVEIKLMKKNDEIVTGQAYLKMPNVVYRSHVSNLGWLDYVSNSEVSGTTGRGFAMEAFNAYIEDGGVEGDIEYSVRSLKSGNQWSNWISGNEIAGSVGNSDGLEAFRVRLKGHLAQCADVYYRVYLPNIGWTGWTKNGDRVGSEHYGYSIQAIQVKLVPKNVNLSGGLAYYSGAQTGVDVSAWNGYVDWYTARNSGISFAMLRCVQGKMNGLKVDTQFNNNIKNAINNGVKVGVYRYGYAVTEQQAQEEARAVVSAIRNSGYRLGMPVAYDVEDAETQGKVSKEELTRIIKAFKGVIEMNGYRFMIYASKNWLENKIDMDAFAGNEVWIARYRDNTPNLGHGYTGKGTVTIWQYTSSGTVPGISGNVDMNICYKQY